jgi:hypothetical protein
MTKFRVKQAEVVVKRHEPADELEEDRKKGAHSILVWSGPVQQLSGDQMRPLALNPNKSPVERVVGEMVAANHAAERQASDPSAQSNKAIADVSEASVHRSVTQEKDNKWVAQITCKADNQPFVVGTFGSQEQAAIAIDRAVSVFITP